MRRRYKEAIKSLTDPTATPEQSAQLAQRAIDNANWASRRIDELIPNGGYAARSMQDTLTGILRTTPLQWVFHQLKNMGKQQLILLIPQAISCHLRMKPE